MSEQATGNSQQTLVIGLVVIAALLAAIVGVIIYQQSSANSLPQPTAQTTPAATDPSGAPAGMGGAPAGMGQGGTEAAAFDPKTATKLEKGVEPEAWVTGYYEACEKDDWKAAFDRLPAAKKANNSPEALKEQVSGYGIEGYKVTSAKVEGDKATVIVDQVTGQYGTFENTWSFVKVDGEWLVENKAVTGMK